MAQRFLKILLPWVEKERGLGLLTRYEELRFWQEEISKENFVVNVLVEAERSEVIMDVFERTFTGIDGFHLIVFSVAASLPRPREPEREKKDNTEKTAEEIKEEKLAKAARVSREELFASISDSARLSRTFMVMTTLAAVVAAVGLLTNNVAVIIGAMVIAPFLGPNVALALSTCLAEKELGNRALKTLVAGISLVLVLTICFGFCWQLFNPQTSLLTLGEIAARTRPTLFDVVLAFASGCAGVWAITTGTSSTLIGVMVAVALLLPLTVVGLLLGAGELQAGLRAFLLFAANIIGINLAGVLTFRARGVTPRTWWGEGKAKAARRRAVVLWSLLLMLLMAVIFSSAAQEIMQ